MRHFIVYVICLKFLIIEATVDLKCLPTKKIAPLKHRSWHPSPSTFSPHRFQSNDQNLKVRPTQKFFELKGGLNLMSLKGSATPQFKIFLQTAITLINILSWAIPLNSNSLIENPKFMNLANCFSGGVFLALAFGHLLPHSIQGFVPLLANQNTASTLACAYCAIGYLLVFIGDRMIFDTEALLEMYPPTLCFLLALTITLISRKLGQGFSPLLVLCALSIHSLMETAALGVQSSKKSAALLAASIGVHQPAESVTILISLLKAGLSIKNIAFLLGAYSLIGPLGLASGLLASDLFGGFVEPVFVALTAGSFIYVAASEIVPTEFNSEIIASSSKIPNFVTFSLGFALIVVLTAVSEYLEDSAEAF